MDICNTIVHNLPRFLVNYTHAQTVNTTPLCCGEGCGLGTRLHGPTYWIQCRLWAYLPTFFATKPLGRLWMYLWVSFIWQISLQKVKVGNIFNKFSYRSVDPLFPYIFTLGYPRPQLPGYMELCNRIKRGAGNKANTWQYVVIDGHLIPQVEILSKVNHRNIIRFYGVVDRKPYYYIITGWCASLVCHEFY